MLRFDVGLLCLRVTTGVIKNFFSILRFINKNMKSRNKF